MAGYLRMKIELVIDPEDIAQVRLQGEIRSEIKRRVKDPTQRKELNYRIIQDKKIFSMLRSNRFEDARQHALDMISRVD